MKDRQIIIGDVHGCIDELKELLNKISYNKETDEIVLVGDLVDRGPDSIGVLRLAQEESFTCLLGNHEQKILKWSTNRHNNSQQYYGLLLESDINFIKSFSKYYLLNNKWIVIHAGLRSNTELNEQSDDSLLYLRYMDKHNKTVPLRKIKNYNMSELKFWTENWAGTQSVIYGHMVHSLMNPRTDVNKNNTCLGIDTGCCFGGHLTAVIMQLNKNYEFVQVKSKNEYSTLHKLR